MLIDWFTVGAQVLNFLILVWLMKRFLYKPILNAIDAREQRIAAELADADAKRDAAQKERDEFDQKNDELDEQRTALMNQAIVEATSERQRLLDEARAAVKDLRIKEREALRDEQQSLAGEITRRTCDEVFAIARKTLADLAEANLEERMCGVFSRRLRGLKGEAKVGFANALNSSSNAAVVRSAFDLPAAQRDEIQLAINETFARETTLDFEIDPTVISGIELAVNGQKVGWSIAEYLMSLERSIDTLLQKQDEPRDKSEVKPESPNA